MPQQDQTPVREAGSAGRAFDSAANATNAMSSNVQAIAGEIFEISKQSFEHTTEAMEKLRKARGVDEVLTIQTNFVKEICEHAAQHAQKFGELMAVLPAELTRTCQDVWLRSLNSAVKMTQAASQTAAEGIERSSEAAKKTSNIFNDRESA